MNAIQPSQPYLQPVKSSAPIQRPRIRRQPQTHRAIPPSLVSATVEATAKFLVHFSLAALAATTLASLIPQYRSQQQTLQALNVETERAEQRVAQLRAEFERYFDPTQTRRLMQEQRHRLDVNHRPIIWTKRSKI